MDSGGSNPSPHACIASALTSELSPGLGHIIEVVHILKYTVKGSIISPGLSTSMNGYILFSLSKIYNILSYHLMDRCSLDNSNIKPQSLDCSFNYKAGPESPGQRGRLVKVSIL